MKRKKRRELKSRHLLIIMTIICIGILAFTVSKTVSVRPVREAASYLIVPFQKGLNGIGSWFASRQSNFQDASELNEQVEQLSARVAQLEEENANLYLDRAELERLRALYNIDQSYSQYEKISASVISKESGSWYNTFIIDKGSDDGLALNMNVLSGGGLVGIITEVGHNWAKVTAIIDESSNISAVTLGTSDTCIVSGEIASSYNGQLSFGQLSTSSQAQVGERLVTSNISDKYLPGIVIGTITDMTEDSNHLTKTGHILPAVDFRSVTEVLVILQTKQTVSE